MFAAFDFGDSSFALIIEVGVGALGLPQSVMQKRDPPRSLSSAPCAGSWKKLQVSDLLKIPVSEG